MKELFKAHLHYRLSQISKIMHDQKVDDLYIESGFPHYYFLDDNPTFFKPNPHFSFLCPATGQGHLLKIEADDSKPTLYFCRPDDFWHEVSELKNDFWEEAFNIEVHPSLESSWQGQTTQSQNRYIISPTPELAIKHGCKVAPHELISALHWLRVEKTEYEQECIKEANKIASLGHIKAKELFLDGASEADIYMQYLLATSQRESEIPYNSIVAFDKATAILHYQNPKKGGSGQTFLIDAGARHNFYCSDITRTHCSEKAHPVFKAIVAELDKKQQTLCSMVKPNSSYVDIHRSAYEMVADMLIDLDLFSGSKEECLDFKVPFHFFPHGIGHPLGLQVHDVAGKQINSKGDLAQQPEDFPYLRTLRDIYENDVLTIEPGFYFIPLLLQELKNNNRVNKMINWDMIDQLIPFGGVRIEDNVVAKQNGPENLTRLFLS